MKLVFHFREDGTVWAVLEFPEGGVQRTIFDSEALDVFPFKKTDRQALEAFGHYLVHVPSHSD